MARDHDFDTEFKNVLMKQMVRFTTMSKLFQSVVKIHVYFCAGLLFFSIFCVASCVTGVDLAGIKVQIKFYGAVYKRHNAVGSASDCRSMDHEFKYQSVHITFMENDHEIISAVILPLSVI